MGFNLDLGNPSAIVDENGDAVEGFVIPNGASDPSNAGPEDLIFEEK